MTQRRGIFKKEIFKIEHEGLALIESEICVLAKATRTGFKWKGKEILRGKEVIGKVKNVKIGKNACGWKTSGTDKRRKPSERNNVDKWGPELMDGRSKGADRQRLILLSKNAEHVA